ncbi:MAG TPA: DUF4058 family protein [Tepidisphaeraceae bacterium]|nr:DUF4058 family protein [Tepidisphaeraceae bacterium]
MPIHDWTRVNAGAFHDFHSAWIPELRKALNGGLLPEGYDAMAEQVAGRTIPDVLTLQEVSGSSDNVDGPGASGGANPPGANDSEMGGVAVASAPPRVAIQDTISDAMLLAARRRRLVIRHGSGDRVVAMLEIVSPGNKERQGALDAFVDKAVGALDEGYHLLVIDVLPPGNFDPTGMHGAIWDRLGATYEPPAGKPLTLASYASAGTLTCYVEPTAVGASLTDMPLFLDPGHYVNVPLESTYMAAYEGTPRRWKRVLEAFVGSA